MIDQLTPEQEAYLPIFRQKYIDDITVKKPFEVQKAAIERFYEFCGLPKPQHVICLPPEHCRNLMAALEILEEEGYKDLTQALKELNAPFETTEAEALVSMALKRPVPNFTNRFNKKRTDTDNCLSFLWSRAYSAWLQFGKYIGAKLDEDKLDLFSSVAENIDACYPYENICLLIDSPLEVHWKEERLHNESGPAVRYSDGFEIYSVDGYLVPKKAVMEPETLTIEDIKQEQNLEARRILIRLYGATENDPSGYERYLKDINAQVLDYDEGITGTAHRALLQDPFTHEKILVCTDGSTNRIYSLVVSGDSKTCREAAESLACFNEDLIIAEG